MSVNPTSNITTTQFTSSSNNLNSTDSTRPVISNLKSTCKDGLPQNKNKFKSGQHARQRKGCNYREKNQQFNSNSSEKTGKKKATNNLSPKSASVSPTSNNNSKPLKPVLTQSSDVDDVYLWASGKKGKGNFTHMMQFTLPPRQSHSETFRRSKQFGGFKRSTPFNKYRYMNANFRFLVRATNEYKLQLINPDDYVDWNDVQQVVVNTSEDLNCPICLCSPVAPRMTACGHLYCHPCVLRYLHEQPADTARNWRKCPICYDPIYSRALKPVMHLLTTTQSKGPGSVSLRLMQRYPGSTVALPYYQDSSKGLEASLPWDDTPGALVFSRLIRCSPKHICSHLKVDKEALLLAFKEAQSQGEPMVAKYIQFALSEITSEISEYSHYKDPISCDFLNEHSDSQSEPPFKFYQSEDGQYLYLLPLHARILIQHYESTIGELPLHLELPVTHYEESTVDEDMRKRFKSLSYLPLGCDVSFIDVDLKSVVSPELIAQYKVPLDARSRHLKAKKKAELREEARSNANHFSALQAAAHSDDNGYDIASDPNAFPDILSSSAPSELPGDNESLAIYGFSPGNSSGNWASMATRTRDSTSNWSVNNKEDQEYAPRSHRTLGEDIDRAIAESMLSLSGLDLESSSGKKNGKKSGKKKLVLVSSSVQRRR